MTINDYSKANKTNICGPAGDGRSEREEASEQSKFN